MTSVAPGVETANASTNSRLVCDVAGNCATAGPIAGTKIDLKAPVINVTTPADGATYPLNGSIVAAYACVDGGSGTETCAGTVANGTPIDTTAAGTRTFVVTATDASGNVDQTPALRQWTVDSSTPDTTPPTVNLTAPAAGTAVAGTVTLTMPV